MAERQQSRETSARLLQEPKTRQNHFQSKRNIVKTSSSLQCVAFNSIWTISLAVRSQPIALCRLNDSEKKKSNEKKSWSFIASDERDSCMCFSIWTLLQIGFVVYHSVQWMLSRLRLNDDLAGHMSMQYEAQLCAIFQVWMASFHSANTSIEMRAQTQRAAVRSESEMKRPITMWR